MYYGMSLRRRSDYPEAQPFYNLSKEERFEKYSEMRKINGTDSKKDKIQNTDKLLEVHKQNITKLNGDNTNMEEKTNVTTTNSKKSETKSKVNYKEMYDYKTIKLAEMQDFIEKYHPEDKEEFKKHAIEYVKIKNTDGVKPVYRHMKARKYFCEKYMPELLPKKKDKVKKSESILNW